MALTKVMLLSTMAMFLIDLSVIKAVDAADAPAPSPVSAAVSVSSSVAVACLTCVVALVFGSALRI